MPDLIQVADDLKQMPDQWLAMQAQQPTGVVPPYLVVAELARRQKLRSARSQPPQQSSVSQDLIQSLQARMPPAQGLPPGSVPPQAVPPGMPPPNLSGAGGPSSPGGFGPPAPGTPPANLRMPARMWDGGDVREDDEEDDDEDNGLVMPSRFLPSVVDRFPTYRQTVSSLQSPINSPASTAVSDPRFAPMEDLPAGSFGYDIWGRPNPAPPKPEILDVSKELASVEQLRGRLSQKPEDYTDPAHRRKYQEIATDLAGGKFDDKALMDEVAYLKQQAEKSKPTWQQALMRWGTNLAASPSPHLGLAMGQAAQQTMNWGDQQKERVREMELGRLKVQAQISQANQNFRQHIGAETVRLQEGAQRQETLYRNQLQNELTRSEAGINRAAQDVLRAKNDYRKRAGEAIANSAKQHMTLDVALANRNNSDTNIRTIARRYLLDKRNYETELDEMKGQDLLERQRQLAEFNSGLRSDEQKELAKIRHGYHMEEKGGPGARKRTDPERLSEAVSLVQDQMDHVLKKGSKYYDENGNEVTRPDGKPAKTANEVWQVMQARAAENLMNPEWFKGHNLFGYDNPNAEEERERAYARIRRLPVPANIGSRLWGRSFTPNKEGTDKGLTNPVEKGEKPVSTSTADTRGTPEPQQPKTVPGTPEGWDAPGSPGVPLIPLGMQTKPAGTKWTVNDGIWWKDEQGNIWFKKQNAATGN
jgi:hypothetical protein